MNTNAAKKYHQIDDSDKPETVDVIVCIKPDLCFAYVWDDEMARDVANDWRDGLTDEKRALHDAARTTGGFIRVRMLKSDFDSIDMTPYKP